MPLTGRSNVTPDAVTPRGVSPRLARKRAFATLRFIASSKTVSVSPGRSPALVPYRILSK